MGSPSAQDVTDSWWSAQHLALMPSLGHLSIAVHEMQKTSGCSLRFCRKDMERPEILCGSFGLQMKSWCWSNLPMKMRLENRKHQPPVSLCFTYLSVQLRNAKVFGGMAAFRERSVLATEVGQDGAVGLNLPRRVRLARLPRDEHGGAFCFMFLWSQHPLNGWLPWANWWKSNSCPQ